MSIDYIRYFTALLKPLILKLYEDLLGCGP